MSLIKNVIITLIIITLNPGLFAQKVPLTVIGNKNAIVYDICFTPNGKAIAITEKNKVSLYSTNDFKLLREYKGGHNKPILAIDISNDSTILASCGRDSMIVLWDISSGEIIRKLDYHKGVVTSVDISNDNRYLASGGTDNKVFIYDLIKREIIGENDEHSNDVTTVCISPDNNIVASAGGDKTIKLYDISKREIFKTLDNHKNWVRDLSFSSDQSKLISCDDNSKVLIWNMSNLENIKLLSEKKYYSSWITSVQYFSDSKSYILGNLKGKVSISATGFYYTLKLNKVIHKVIFKPNTKSFLIAAIATRGDGVIIIEAKNMKYK